MSTPNKLALRKEGVCSFFRDNSKGKTRNGRHFADHYGPSRDPYLIGYAL